MHVYCQSILLFHSYSQICTRLLAYMFMEVDSYIHTYTHTLHTAPSQRVLGAQVASKFKNSNTCVHTYTHTYVTHRALIQRVLGAQVASKFEIEMVDREQDSDFFEVGDAPDGGGKVLLRGTTGVAVASALNWYLRCVAVALCVAVASALNWYLRYVAVALCVLQSHLRLICTSGMLQLHFVLQSHLRLICASGMYVHGLRRRVWLRENCHT